MTAPPPLGAHPRADGWTEVGVWAPYAEDVRLCLHAPEHQTIPMDPAGDGYFRVVTEAAPPGARYTFRLNGQNDYPDPASRFQSDGVHEPSAVVEPHFDWQETCWPGLSLEEHIFYELHVGTFTPEGTFDAVIPYLDELVELGVTAIEPMPIAQFPGGRNWGYDGVYPFAAQNTYGGPDGFRRLVDACHARGLAVVLDVVYNHLGPEGNYLGAFGPYFTDRYETPWGPALNFDGPDSDPVRRYFLDNARYWIRDCGVDGLRLDAIQTILDLSATPFLQELAEVVAEQARQLGRRVHLFPESDRNDPRHLRPQALGGYGLDAQWTDDFHHALHAVLTGERVGYYADFGRIEQLRDAYRNGFVLRGQYSAFRKRRHGAPAPDRPGRQFIVYAQNHDQIGNRLRGDRLGPLVGAEAAKLAAGAVLLSPFLPMLFMGEAYGETAPFLYFTSHSDPDLVEAVREGRQREFAAFGWEEAPPDPQDERTFERSRLDHERKTDEPHRRLWRYHQELIRLRKAIPALARPDNDRLAIHDDLASSVIGLRRWTETSHAGIWLNVSEAPRAITPASRLPSGRWAVRLDSTDRQWGGPGRATPDVLDSETADEISLPPYACVLLTELSEIEEEVASR